MSIKRMNIKEFRKKGYLQEVNRRFFHPLGLALEVVVDDETGEEKLGGIWDYRDDPEGIIFDKDVTENPEFEKKANFIESEINKRRKEREKLFGSIIQSIA